MGKPADLPVETTVNLPSLDIRAAVVPSTFNAEARTVEFTFSTGARVLRGYWDRYYEELSLDPAHCRLDRLNRGAPFLKVHNSYELENVLGVIERAWIEQGEGRVLVRFSEREDISDILRDIETGILPNVSVGYSVYRFEQVEGGDETIPVYRAVDWEPFEVSLVPIPADAGAQVRSNDTDGTKPCVFINRGTAATSKKGDIMPEVQTAAAENTSQAEIDTRAAAAQKEGEQAGIAAERQRVADIRKAVRALPADQRDAMADKFIEDGSSVDAVRSAVIEKLAAASAATETRSAAVDIVVGEDGARIKARDGLENALLHRHDGSHFKLEEVGRNYRGMSLIELARDYCQTVLRIDVRGMDKMTIAGLALGMNVRGGMHTTSDFPFILANVANKTMRRAYDIAAQTWKPLARQANLSDFKQRSVVQLGEAPQLKKVNENGEFTRGTVGEGKEVYQLATYGRILAVTRQAIVNDDLDAFTRLPALFGNSAADLESDLVWEQITSNPTMGDGTALFAAGHGNLAGAGAAISVTSIGAARTAMRKQKGLDAKQFINVNAQYLLVPAALETVADQFVSTAMLANQNSNVNPFAGRLQVIAEPRLDANSATAWYTAGSPAQIDMIEYGYLEGAEGPQIETRMGFEVDGMEIKCREDFVAKVIDWRGFYKNPGA